MLITLEGVDGAGKSGLAFDIAAELKKRYPNDKVDYLHAGPLKTDAYEAYLEPLKDYKPNTGVHYVLDRWHVGERIYGPLYRGKSKVDDATWVWLELKFAALGMTTWHVTQQLSVIRERLAARGEDFLQDEHVEHVHGEFYRHLTLANSATFRGRVEPEGDNGRLVEQIISSASLNEALTPELPRSYVGDPDAEYLLVGDRRGGPGPYPYDGAFRPVNGNSATYLLQALYDASQGRHYELNHWQLVAFINSAPDEEPELDRALNVHAVGALGCEAQKRIPDDKRTTFFPHPQYVRRFHNKLRGEYGKLILDNITTGEDLSKWPNL